MKTLARGGANIPAEKRTSPRRSEHPRGEANIPAEKRTSPRRSEHPRGEANIPAVARTSPRWREHPRGGANIPAEKRASPREERASPQMSEHPRGKASFPAGGANIPADERTSPRMSVHPRGGANIPAEGRECPREERAFPRMSELARGTASLAKKTKVTTQSNPGPVRQTHATAWMTAPPGPQPERRAPWHEDKVQHRGRERPRLIESVRMSVSAVGKRPPRGSQAQGAGASSDGVATGRALPPQDARKISRKDRKGPQSTRLALCGPLRSLREFSCRKVRERAWQSQPHAALTSAPTSPAYPSRSASTATSPSRRW
jgi:hypothetical protein